MSKRNVGSDDPETGADESATEGREGGRSISRRDFLTASAGASALYLGAIGSVAGASTVAQTTTGMGELYVPDGNFKAINNDWSAPSAEMATYLYDDGSYGWEWDRGGTGVGDPNYPQSLVGNKPWGTATGADAYPIKRKNVDTLEMALDVDVTADKSQGEWNLTEEWWLVNEEPALGRDTGSAVTHEIMTVFEWSDAHDHGYPLEKGAFTDRYGNTFDYWEQYDIGWSFHIFRIQGNSAPSQVDFTPVMDYVGDNFGAGGDLWMTGMEVGNEYWDYTSGSTRIHQFDVTVNGTTHESGANVGQSDTTAPDAVSNLRCTGHDSSSVDLAWDASASGDVYEHRVLVDGSYDHSMSASATSTSVNSVSGGTCHDFAVQAIDGAGNVASASNVVSVDPGTGTCGSGGDSTEADGSGSTEEDGSDSQSPYDGSPAPIPGTVEAEDFDEGGSGVAYSDSTAGNEGSNYRTTDVDVAGDDEGDYAVGWITGGEWLEYTVDVEAAGTYDLTVRATSSGGGGPFHVEMDGTDVTGDVSVPDTGGWNAYQTVTVEGVDLQSGTQVMRVAMDGGAFNLDHLAWSTSSTSGDATSDGDSTAPTAPANLSAPTTTESSVDLTWDAAADDGGSGLDHYAVYVDGASDHQVPAGTTSTTVDGLSSGTSYDLAVGAVDGAGNESAKAGPVGVSTDAEETESSGSATGGLTLNDYDGDPGWGGTNDLGKWEGSGSFDSAGVQGEALRLEFTGGGWLQSYVSRDVSGYSQLKFRIRGDDGGEESAFAVKLGSGGGVLADLTDDSVGTTFSTVAVDMDAAGMDPSAPGKLELNFWAGEYASGAIDIDRIWFE